ncbi:MAG: Na+:H+ antiporter, NhaA family [Actinomycetota bacterium]|nr:Na+:H+ antiporter, NhaA family [Actinomycetota bacterium]
MPAALLPLALRDFLRTETAGGLVLVVAAVVALGWANSPWAGGYERLWHTQIDLAIGTVGFSGDLRHLVNDGLMALFFFVVGLEIKRELVTGELRHWRTAALPAIAALGGMVVPALLYLGVVALASGGTGQRGWGIPMATDIAFAVGVVALLGRRVPASLELFLLTLAIVDDIGAILVIAVVYSDGISFTPLLAAALLVGAMALLRFRGVRWLPVYVLLGIGVWLACYESGVHATIAGALLGLLAPARPVPAESAVPAKSNVPAKSAVPAKSNISVAERLEHQLHPVTSFVVVPLFALANAGVVLRADALDAPGATGVALGVVLGLVVGKLLGVSLSAWLAVRLGIGSLPDGATWAQLVGIAAVAGIGFTVSLFVAELAFDDPALVDSAKAGVLVASVLASALGVTLLLGAGRRARQTRLVGPADAPGRTGR